MLDPWSPAQARKKLATRLQRSREFAETNIHPKIEANTTTVYSTSGLASGGGGDFSDPSVVVEGQTDQPVQASTGVNYSFKNVRFIHAQMSANPPTSIPRPSTSDPEDRRRARAADRVMRYALRQYNLQEKFDQSNLQTLLAGTGFLKTTWDPHKGDIVGISKKTGRLRMEGDLVVKCVDTRRVYLDPDAEAWDEVRYVFEEITVPYEEAIHRWPAKRQLIESLMTESGTAHQTGSIVVAGKRQEKFESITAYEYWETGLPSNAMLGRYAVCLADGRCLEPARPSPFAFAPPPTAMELMRARKTGKPPRERPPTARLPYHPLTDVDVPNQVWGKSFVEFEAPLQELLNRLDTVMLENLQAHGVARLILPDGVDIQKGAVTNSPWDIVRLSSKGAANAGDLKFMEPMPMPPSLAELRSQTRGGIDDMAGVNESMFGQQSREQSGFSMQYATNQGNMVRRRLFNKYVLQVESVYRAILDLIRKHWHEERTIQVLGKEKAFEVIDIKGADIDGGYDIVVEYGTSLSLDPMTRRQELMALQPLLEQAGIPKRTILSMMKLGELDVVDDLIQMAEDRQREIFEEMFATGVYILPDEFEDHENMLAYALRFRMSSDYKYLEFGEKEMVKQHIRDRAKQAAAEKAPPVPPGAPGPAGSVTQVPGAGAGAAVATPVGAVTEPAAVA